MKNILKRFFLSLSLAAPFGLFVLAFVNIIISVFCYRSTRPQFHYKLFVVTNYVSSVVTSLVHSSSVIAPGDSRGADPDHVPLNVPKSIPVNYDYCVVAGTPIIRYLGTNYREGDLCSRGLILRIFPDRVFLMDGTVLENAKFANERNFKHDGRTNL